MEFREILTNSVLAPVSQVILEYITVNQFWVSTLIIFALLTVFFNFLEIVGFHKLINRNIVMLPFMTHSLMFIFVLFSGGDTNDIILAWYICILSWIVTKITIYYTRKEQREEELNQLIEKNKEY